LLLKVRSPVSLALELGLPAVFVGVLIMIRGLIGDATTFPERIPVNGGVPVLRYSDFSNYTAFKLTNVNINCAYEVESKKGNAAKKIFDTNPTKYCQFLKFAILPRCYTSVLP
jgi:hypothetical protein